MRYELNVSRDGKHFFATHERSLTDFDSAMKMFVFFKMTFPASDGFEVTLTRWEERGTEVATTMETKA